MREGSEGSGEIIEIGKKVSHLHVGDKVIVGELNCVQVSRLTLSLKGMAGGTLAEEAIVPSLLCMKKPDSWSHEEASGLFVGFMTSYHGF